MPSFGKLVRHVRSRSAGIPPRLPASRARPFLNKTVVIGIHAGGLGDHLAYSALPRLYKTAGAARVLLSRRTNLGEPLARNPEIIDYVWGRNPYVDGLTDEPANVGETGWPPLAFFEAAKHATSPIDAIAETHGLSVHGDDGETRIVPTKPDLFYRPKRRPDFTGKIVCDPHSISQRFSPAVFNAFVSFVCDWHEVAAGDAVVLRNTRMENADPDILPSNPRYLVRDIFEYTDIVAAARSFLVTESGGQSVAAAVRTAATFVLTTTRAFNQRHFLWPANTYCVTGEMTPKDAEWPMRPVPHPKGKKASSS